MDTTGCYVRESERENREREAFNNKGKGGGGGGEGWGRSLVVEDQAAFAIGYKGCFASAFF